MNIGEAAEASGVTAKMIRYYESIDLIPVVTRTEAGYRIYSPADVHTFRFIKRARNLGFSIEQISQLLVLWRDRTRASNEVKILASRHIRELKSKIAEMQGMVQTLEELVKHCQGDHRPECPILNDLSDKKVPPGRDRVVFGRYPDNA